MNTQSGYELFATGRPVYGPASLLQVGDVIATTYTVRDGTRAPKAYAGRVVKIRADRNVTMVYTDACLYPYYFYGRDVLAVWSD